MVRIAAGGVPLPFHVFQALASMLEVQPRLSPTFWSSLSVTFQYLIACVRNALFLVTRYANAHDIAVFGQTLEPAPPRSMGGLSMLSWQVPTNFAAGDPLVLACSVSAAMVSASMNIRGCPPPGIGGSAACARRPPSPSNTASTAN